MICGALAARRIELEERRLGTLRLSDHLNRKRPTFDLFRRQFREPGVIFGVRTSEYERDGAYVMGRVRIAVVDDHPLFREGVKRSLGEISDFEVVAEGSTKEDAIRIAREYLPDVMLLDISIPGGGLEAIPFCPGPKIVVLTVSESRDDVTSALNSGAKGYVLKGIGSRELVEIIRAVASGEGYVSPVLSARLLSGLSSMSASSAPDSIAELTAREYEVLNLASTGLSNKGIALKLDLHEKTVKHYMGRIFQKLDVTNRTEAAMALRDAGYENRSAREAPFGRMTH